MLFSAPGARVLNNCITQAGYRIVKVKSHGRFSGLWLCGLYGRAFAGGSVVGIADWSQFGISTIRIPLRRRAAAVSCDWCRCCHWRMRSLVPSQTQSAKLKVSTAGDVTEARITTLERRTIKFVLLMLSLNSHQNCTSFRAPHDLNFRGTWYRGMWKTCLKLLRRRITARHSSSVRQFCALSLFQHSCHFPFNLMKSRRTLRNSRSLHVIDKTALTSPCSNQ